MVKIQVNGIADLLKTNLDKGINGDEEELVKRKNAFGSNTYPKKKGRSFWVILKMKEIQLLFK